MGLGRQYTYVVGLCYFTRRRFQQEQDGGVVSALRHDVRGVSASSGGSDDSARTRERALGLADPEIPRQGATTIAA